MRPKRAPPCAAHSARRHWLRAGIPLLVVRYEDLVASDRHRAVTLQVRPPLPPLPPNLQHVRWVVCPPHHPAVTLQTIAEFLVARARDDGGGSGDDGEGGGGGGGEAGGGGGAAAAAALEAMLSRVQRTVAAGGGGVYTPRRGRAGGSLRRYGAEERAEVLRAAAAEMCLFRYNTDDDGGGGGGGGPEGGPDDGGRDDGGRDDGPEGREGGEGGLGGLGGQGRRRPGLGMPLDDEPHPLYLRPAEAHHASAAAAAPHRLNVGACLRPKDDARGWRVARLRADPAPR